ncbi:MAG: hypothetical protein AAFZ07_28420 [Actinomycetota bacterium]
MTHENTLTLAKAMSEAELQSTVMDYAATVGWLCHHARKTRHASGKVSTPIQGHKGFPDVVFARTGRLVIVEFKSHRGTLSPEQRAWAAVLGSISGIELYVWRPLDWLDDTIERILR